MSSYKKRKNTKRLEGEREKRIESEDFSRRKKVDIIELQKLSFFFLLPSKKLSVDCMLYARLQKSLELKAVGDCENFVTLTCEPLKRD